MSRSRHPAVLGSLKMSAATTSWLRAYLRASIDQAAAYPACGSLGPPGQESPLRNAHSALFGVVASGRGKSQTGRPLPSHRPGLGFLNAGDRLFACMSRTTAMPREVNPLIASSTAVRYRRFHAGRPAVGGSGSMFAQETPRRTELKPRRLKSSNSVSGTGRYPSPQESGFVSLLLPDPLTSPGSSSPSRRTVPLEPTRRWPSVCSGPKMRFAGGGVGVDVRLPPPPECRISKATPTAATATETTMTALRMPVPPGDLIEWDYGVHLTGRIGAIHGPIKFNVCKHGVPPPPRARPRGQALARQGGLQGCLVLALVELECLDRGIAPPVDNHVETGRRVLARRGHRPGAMPAPPVRRLLDTHRPLSTLLRGDLLLHRRQRDPLVLLDVPVPDAPDHHNDRHHCNDDCNHSAHCHSLEVSAMHRTPLQQLASWLEDAQAAALTQPDAMTLATASADGVPSARMVLLRGLDDRGAVFYTNAESRKGRELLENPRAALVFHWEA